jgi:hypothetical protein
MAATKSITTVTVYDKNGVESQCDPRQYKALQASGYSLTKPVEAPVKEAPVNTQPVQPVKKPVTKTAAKSTAK